jgi:hypothetical protein
LASPFSNIKSERGENNKKSIKKLHVVLALAEERTPSLENAYTNKILTQHMRTMVPSVRTMTGGECCVIALENQVRAKQNNGNWS